MQKRLIPKLRAEAERDWPNEKIPDSYYEKSYFDDLHSYLSMSRCVSEDDPRLRSK
jgi:hypothetical protein